MQEKKNENGGALGDSAKSELIIELFLNEKYQFRRNVLNGKVEYAVKAAVDELVADDDERWMPLAQEDLNSIVIAARREGVDERDCRKSDVELLLYSKEVRAYDPIRQYLTHLPQWDGRNHVALLLSRLPGLTTEQASFLTVWLRSAVAHWLLMDTLHGNECVPTLIGAQGCGKTTFLRRLLPVHLRQYYLDHLNLSNKFDKEMALTNNLLVNLDELEAIRPSQHAALKQTLSKNKVNGRPIFGRQQQDRPRYASFVATTNNPHPLTDVTGSRRFLCVTIPQGQFIDNAGDIDYEQLYAQLVYEVVEQKSPYWFTNDEVARIQELNLEYKEESDITEMVKVCFRKPVAGETSRSMSCMEMLEVIQKDYPSVKHDRSTRISLGLAMKELGFDHTIPKNVPHYQVIPLRTA